jgi:hypothetical protein
VHKGHTKESQRLNAKVANPQRKSFNERKSIGIPLRFDVHRVEMGDATSRALSNRWGEAMSFSGASSQ